MNPQSTALIFAMTCFFCGSPADACTKDTDCKGDRICVEAVCTAPTGTGGPTPPAQPVMPVNTAVSSESRTAFYGNLLGLLQFGLTPTLEMGGSKTILVRGRLLNTGLLPYLLAAEEGETFEFGIGLGFLARTYVGGQSQQGPYFGAGIEVMNAGSTDDYNGNEYSTTSLIPQVEGGIRWDYPNYIVGVGAFLGATVPISTSGYDMDEADSLVAAGLMVDVGWYL